MVLVIENQVYSNKCTLDNLAQHTSLIHSSLQFANSTECKQPVEQIAKTIYVHQREFAVVGKNDPNGFDRIGSDDATTCHILILDNQNAVGLIHLDGGKTHESIERMLREMEQYAPQNTNYDMYLGGGFLDGSEAEHSRTLSNKVLNIFAKIPNMSFYLKLAAITPYNDHIINNIHYPLIYGLCFDVNSKTLRKMNFIDYGPAFRLRSVYLAVHDHCAFCIYSSLKGRITLDEFTISKYFIDQHYGPLYLYCFSDDQKLLDMTSTSPKQERSSYVIHMKKTILYILKYWKDLSQWFDPQTHSIVYYRSNQKWITDNTKIVEEIEIE